MRRSAWGAVLVGLLGGVTEAAPLAAPAIAPGARTFPAFSGSPARIRIAWTPVEGATRYRAAWSDEAGTRVNVEVPGTSTVFERTAIAGHHELTITAVDATGRESAPASIGVDVVGVVAIAPGDDEPTEPASGRVFAVGTRFSSPGLTCQLGDAPRAPEVIAPRPGQSLLVCGGEPGQPRLEAPLVIAPVIVASQASPLRVGTPTIVHVALASAADLGAELDVVSEAPGFEIDAIERTDGGLQVTITATAVATGFVHVASHAVVLGRFEVTAIAAPPPAIPDTVRSRWFALELGAYSGVLVPGLSTPSNIGHPTDRGDAVGWGPMFGGRVGVFPTRRIGLELEAALAPTGYEERPGVAAVLAARVQLVGRVVEDQRYGLRLVAGADLLAQLVERGTSQHGVTGGVHYGAAFSIEIAPRSYIRLAALHVIMPALDFTYAHGFELQFGVSKRFGRVDRW